MRSASPPHLLTVADLAAYLRVTRQTVWRWIREGRLPAPQQYGPKSHRWTPDQLATVAPGLTRPDVPPGQGS